MASPIASCHGYADLEVQGGTNTITWSFVAGAKFYNIYRAPPAVDSGTGTNSTLNPVPPGSIFGFVGSSYGTQFAGHAKRGRPAADAADAPEPVRARPDRGGGCHVGRLRPRPPPLYDHDIHRHRFFGLSDHHGRFDGRELQLPVRPVHRRGEALSAAASAAPSSRIPARAISPAIRSRSTARASLRARSCSGPISTAGDTITLSGIVWILRHDDHRSRSDRDRRRCAWCVTLACQLAAGSRFERVVGVERRGLRRRLRELRRESAHLLYKTAGTGGNSYTLAAEARPHRQARRFAGGSGTGSAGAASTGSLQLQRQPDQWPKHRSSTAG